MIIALLLVTSVHAIAESKLRNNIITNLEPVQARSFSEEINAVVVGYDGAVTDYHAAAQVAVHLTALHQKEACMLGDLTLVPLNTDREPTAPNMVLVGGPFSNELAKKYSEVDTLLEQPWKIT